MPTVKGQGLPERRYGWYALGIAVNALALVLVVTGVVLIGPPRGRCYSPHRSPVLSARTAFIARTVAAKGRAGFRRRLTRNQAWLFFPLTLLEGVALRTRSSAASTTRSSTIVSQHGRPHLLLGQPLVRAFCRELGISYSETGLVDSYRQALRPMDEAGAPLRVE